MYNTTDIHPTIYVGLLLKLYVFLFLPDCNDCLSIYEPIYKQFDIKKVFQDWATWPTSPMNDKICLLDMMHVSG